MLARSSFAAVIFGMVALFAALCPVSAAPIKVGPYLVNAESTFTGSDSTYTAPISLGATTRLVVQVAPQYAIDFGIIPAADLKKWRSGQPVRYLLRLIQLTDTRYVTLNAGQYYVVARNLGGAGIANGFSVKVRKFTAKANDNGVKRAFLKNQTASDTVLPNNWQGFRFQVPSSGKMWFDGVFSRGTDRRVKWEILTEAEYQKFVSGLNHKSLLTGSNSKALGFHFMANPAGYYFVVINQGASYSAYTVTREIYR